MGMLEYIRREQFKRTLNYAAALTLDSFKPIQRRVIRQFVGVESMQPARWRRGLILGATHIGDILYRTCSLEHLHASLPDCTWDYVTEPATQCILENNPYITNILPFRLSQDDFFLSREQIGYLKDQHYDVCLCTNHVRYWPDMIRAIRLRIPSRAGFIHKGGAGLVTSPVLLNRTLSAPALFRQMVATIIGHPPTWQLRPQIFLTERERESSRQILARMGLSTSRKVLIFPSTRQEMALWPLDHYAEFIVRAREELNAVPVLCGAGSDRAYLDEIKKRSGIDAAIIAGEMSIREVVAMMEESLAILTMDSGPRHLANAVKLPAFFFRCTHVNAVEAGIYCQHETDLLPQGEYMSKGQQEQVMRACTPTYVLSEMRRISGAKVSESA